MRYTVYLNAPPGVLGLEVDAKDGANEFPSGASELVKIGGGTYRRSHILAVVPSDEIEGWKYFRPGA